MDTARESQRAEKTVAHDPVDKHARDDDSSPFPDAKRVKTESDLVGVAEDISVAAAHSPPGPVSASPFGAHVKQEPSSAQPSRAATVDGIPGAGVPPPTTTTTSHDRSDAERSATPQTKAPVSTDVVPASSSAPASTSASTAASPDKKSAEEKDRERRLRKAALDKQRRERKKAEKLAAAAAEAVAVAEAAAAPPAVKSEKAVSEGKDSKKRPRSKLDELKAERARSASTAPPGTPGSGDDDQYCICKGANEDDETYIGCETCDNWFHPSCMGIEEDNVDLLDVYICPPCEERTGRTTVYNRLCKRERCERTARLTSKFCSSRCAFQHAKKIASGIDKTAKDVVAASLAGYPSPTPSIVVEHVGSPRDAKPSASTSNAAAAAALLANLEVQAEDVARAAQLVAQRQALLARAVERWEGLTPLAGGAEPAPAPKKNSKNKRRDAEPLAERPCGYDHRLAWGDGEVASWAAAGVEEAGEEENEPCGARRRCERHQGWQRTLGVQLDVEAAQLARRKDELDAMVDRVERLEGEEAGGRRARESVHARLRRGKGDDGDA